MAQFSRFSSPEWEVAKLLLRSKNSKLIASSLGISEHTVEFHLRNIYSKFQARSRIELILKLGYSIVDGMRESIEKISSTHGWIELHLSEILSL